MTIFVKDPCGFICITLTYVAVFYADYVVIRWVIMQTMQDRPISLFSAPRVNIFCRFMQNQPSLKKENIKTCLWAPFHVVLFNTVIFMLSLSHLRAMCSDPGAVPLPQNRMDFSDIHSGSESLLQNEDWTVCTRCETYRPPRAHHCRICKRCIRRMDHHCPWINNCVGERNQKYFIQFLVYVGLLSLYAIALVATSWLRACPQCSTDVNLKQARILHCVILVLESALFGMFVMAILYDQLEALANDETTIEQLQAGGGRGLSIHKIIMSQLCRLPCTSTGSLRSPADTHSV